MFFMVGKKIIFNDSVPFLSQVWKVWLKIHQKLYLMIFLQKSKKASYN